MFAMRRHDYSRSRELRRSGDGHPRGQAPSLTRPASDAAQTPHRLEAMFGLHICRRHFSPEI
jgi:hypothetical protein